MKADECTANQYGGQIALPRGELPSQPAMTVAVEHQSGDNADDQHN
jgi:hypothetical protein